MQIEITPGGARELRKLYDKAVAAGQPQFEFRGQAVLVVYAYYLLEHLSNELRDPSLKPPERPRP